MAFELLSVALTALAAGLFYLSAPSQCLLRHPLSAGQGVLPGGGCLLLAVAIMAQELHVLAACLAVGALLMLSSMLLPFLIAVFRTQGRLL
ncbi:hypothetical protein [Gluconobacter japonicus]|uniref:hypothetical protein n=1 Tax=Gluconobacter japonicus TaxID=376620 RepID=UPI0039E7E52B